MKHRHTPPEAMAVVIELLMIMRNQEPKAVHTRICEIPDEHKPDIIGIAVGMIASANEMIAEMKGLPVDEFMKTMGINVAIAKADYD